MASPGKPLFFNEVAINLRGKMNDACVSVSPLNDNLQLCSEPVSC